MPDKPRSLLPAWAVGLVALLVPIVIGFGFLVVFGWANQPMSVKEYQSDPHMGQKLADRNNVLILLHALAQLAFVTVGVWRITTRPVVRIMFFLIATPVSVLVFFVSLVGLIAK